MMTVRFPTGFSIQYNAALWVHWAEDSNGFHALFTSDPTKGGKLIAKVPGTAIIEWERPCVMSNPASGLTAEKAADLLLASGNMKSLGSGKLRELKNALRKYDAKRYCWKN